MHHILFISYDGLTDQLGQSQILPYLIGLTKSGYQFTILSCEKRERFSLRKHIIEEVIKGHSIKWVPLFYHKNPPILSSVYDYQNLLRTALNIHKKQPFSMVHTRPGIPTLVALQLKKKHGIKFLNDVRGFWADERVDGNLWNLRNPLYKTVYTFFKRKEEECLKVNDYTTCLTHSAKREMGNWNILINKEKVEVIPCSVDLGLFDPQNVSLQQKNELRAQLSIDKKEFVISYLGSTGTWYMMDEMFRFFKTLQAKIDNTRFLIISPAVEHLRLREFLATYHIDQNRVIIRELERKEVPLYLSICQYSIFFIKPCFSKLSSSPTKHGEIMAMGIPVVTNSGVGDVKEIVESSRSGIVLDHFCEQDFTAAIEKMKTMIYDPQSIREAAEQYYSLANAVSQYEKVYREVLGN